MYDVLDFAPTNLLWVRPAMESPRAPSAFTFAGYGRRPAIDLSYVNDDRPTSDRRAGSNIG